MSKKVRSARGQIVDFDLLAIKQQLATVPAPVSVNQRRKFIDEKDGVKTKASIPDALLVSIEAANQSADIANTADKQSDKVDIIEETQVKKTKSKG